eukprot:1500105-Amphidinium_carterae.1
MFAWPSLSLHHSTSRSCHTCCLSCVKTSQSRPARRQDLKLASSGPWLLDEHVLAYVMQRQKAIKYGEPGKVVEIEADEVTICRFNSSCPAAPISWIGYVGIVARCKPRSLRLHQLPIRKTNIKSPSPGPTTVQQWLPLTRACFTKGHVCVLHTDSVCAYSRDIPHVHHTNVVHQLKKVGGVWVRPVFSDHKRITLENGDHMHLRSSMQCIYGFWTILRSCLTGGVRSNVITVDSMVCLAQYSYW